MAKIKKNNPWLIFVVVAGLLFFLHIFGFLRPLEIFLVNLAKPLSSRLYAVGSSLNHENTEKETLSEQAELINSLKKEISGLVVANSRLQELEAENNKLRAQLKFLDSSRLKVINANIIAKEIATEAGEEGQNLVINKGSRDGLGLGYAVVSEEGAVVGKIIDLKEASARICLTTSLECRFPAAIQNVNKTQGITNGDLGLTIKMNFIPQLEKISLGDIVISSGLGGNIPRGLVIGRVIQVKNESNDVWQEATIESPVNFNNLTIVSVILP